MHFGIQSFFTVLFLISVLPSIQAQNLLINPGFEEGHTNGIPFGWTAWSDESWGKTSYWTGLAYGRTGNGTRVIGGTINGQRFDGGLYQQVTGLAPGQIVDIRGWASGGQQDGPSRGTQIGYDPTGGTNWNASTVVWVPMAPTASTWRPFLSGLIETESGSITVFTRGFLRSLDSTFWSDFDDFSLTLGAATPTQTLTVTPWPTGVDTWTPTPTHTPTATPTSTPTGLFPPHTFGIGGVWWGAVPWENEDRFNDLMLRRITDAGGTTHIWGIHWCVIEPEKGEYDWSRYDQELDLLTARGSSPVGLIVTSPAWASYNGESGNFPPGEHAVDDFIEFCRIVADRYKDRIFRFSFWNEPDIVWGWGKEPNPIEYATWLKRYYEGIKAGNPDALAGTGGFLGRSLSFIEACYTIAGASRIDAVAIHPYPDLSGQQGHAFFDDDMIATYRSVMLAHGDADTPMWCTEFGWEMTHTSFETIEYYLRESYRMMLENDFVTLSNLHIIADWTRNPSGAHMGVCDVNLHPRPFYRALQEIATGRTPTPVRTPEPDLPNLVANGEFEDGLTGWTVWHEDEFLGHGSVDIAPGYSGDSLRIRGSSIYDTGVYRVVSGLDPSKTYCMTAWVRASEVDQTMRFSMAGYDPTGQTAHG